MWDEPKFEKILTLLKKVYPQFHPSRAFELRAVVVAKRNAPVSPVSCGNGRLQRMGGKRE